jgi:hypothetical protein
VMTIGNIEIPWSINSIHVPVNSSFECNYLSTKITLVLLITLNRRTSLELVICSALNVIIRNVIHVVSCNITA